MSIPKDGVLPSTWLTSSLGEVADVQLGKMLDKKRTEGTSLPYLRNINVRWGYVDTSDLLEMPFKANELERYGIEDDDVLVCEGGEPGRAAVWRGGETHIKYQKALHRVRLGRGLLPRWFVYQLMLDASNGRLARHFTGTTIAHLPREALAEYELRIAPGGEQHRIVEAIDSYFTRLDDALATLERVQQKLKAYRASVLKAAVEGRLVPTEAELARAEGREYEPASKLLERILVERRRRWEEAELAKMKARGEVPRNDKWKAKYKEPVAPDTSALPELPEGWCWASADSLCETVDSGTTPTKEHFVGEGGTPFIKVYNLTFDGTLDFSERPTFVSPVFEQTKMGRSRTIPGDVLTNIVGPPLGKVAVVPATYESWNINQAITRFRALPGLASQFLSLYLQSPPCKLWLAKTAKTTTSQVNLSISTCRRLPVPLAPVAEQQRVVDRVEELLSVASACTEQRERSAARVLRLRQAILKWAFEGKLVDQDPSDEPASVLLDRIRAERATAAPVKKRGRKPKKVPA